MLRDTEQKIEELANMMERTKGCQIPRCIHQIFDLLYKTFADLRKDLKNGDVLMEQHSYLLDSEVFNGCATRMERIRFTLYHGCRFGFHYFLVVPAGNSIFFSILARYENTIQKGNFSRGASV